jgi:predicted PurR-regulated permease PerM
MSDNKVLDISWETIIKLAVALTSFYLIYLLRDILVWIIFAIIISVLFNPAIDFLQKRRVPRVMATILIYVFVFGILGFSIYAIAPIFITEIQQFSQFFPEYFEKIAPPLKGLGIEAFSSFEKFVGILETNLTQASSNIFTAIGAVFGGLFSTLTIFSIAIFLSLEEKGVERMVGIFSPKKYEAFVLNVWAKSQKKVSGWFGARILCCLFVGLTTFLTCYVLNVNYSITFAFLSGILNFIPLIGPIVTVAFIGIFIALDSWVKALFFLVAFIIIQQIEGNILTPVLTKRFIGLSPALVLISLIIGAKLWGMMGAILTIPLAGILFETLHDFLKKRKEEKAVVL